MATYSLNRLKGRPEEIMWHCRALNCPCFSVWPYGHSICQGAPVLPAVISPTPDVEDIVAGAKGKVSLALATRRAPRGLTGQRQLVVSSTTWQQTKRCPCGLCWYGNQQDILDPVPQCRETFAAGTCQGCRPLPGPK